MARATTNGIHIEYETLGESDGRPLLLISGLAGQLIHWDNEVCNDLVKGGHYVIRFDNRDAGLSTKCDHEPDYTLDNMADDAIGLLDFLGVPEAHVCGTSMGGMIAQTMAIRHPSRVRSLISIYSTTGSKDAPAGKPETIKFLLSPAPQERFAHIEHMVTLFKMMAGRGFLFDEAWTRTVTAKAYDRSFCPEGTARQVHAVANQIDRTTALALLKIPTLVIHGTDDPVIPVEAGRQTARTVPCAELVLIEGMGHDLPHGGAWPKIVETLTAHTSRNKR